MWKTRNGRQRLAALMLFLIGACVSGPAASEGEILFQSSSAAQNVQLQIYADDLIILEIDGERFSFPGAERATPRWAGHTYRAEADGRELSLDIHIMRPCTMDGVSPPRTASVLIRLDDAEFTACGFYTNPSRR